MLKVVHCLREQFTHYIGRNAKYHKFESKDADLGNPCDTGTRWEMVNGFETYARGNPAVMARIKALPRNAVLGCYCWPNACHGDVIAKLWDEMHPRGCVPPAAS